MAQNVFDATLDVNNNIKQNVFDWTHNNNLTTQLGRITPIFCDLLPAKSSFRVDPNFGMQFMPMVFPIQTSMRARVAFFRYPLRALWEDYTDFVGNFREGLEEPYVDINTQDKLKKMVSTCSLGDYLGLPTTLLGDYGSLSRVESDASVQALAMKGNALGGSSACTSVLPLSSDLYSIVNADSNYRIVDSVSSGHLIIDAPGKASADTEEVLSTIFLYPFIYSEDVVFESSDSVTLEITTPFGYTPESFYSILSGFSYYFRVGTDTTGIASPLNLASYSITSTSVILQFDIPSDWIGKSTSGEDIEISIAVPLFNSFCRYLDGNARWEYVPAIGLSHMYPDLPPSPLVGVNDYDISPNDSFFNVFKTVFCRVLKNSGKVADISLSSSPYYNSLSANKDKQIKLSAYAFRAYEGIYNAYFRDNRNNPYYIDGKVQYNKWIPTLAGGKDDNIYELRYANWERDFLTTAVQSPQQGTAPLVGITTYTQTVSNEDGTTTELVKTALVDEDGKKFGLSYKTSDDGLEGVEYTELSDGTQVRQARNLYDLATSGISIADLRAVNAYQKFLELNMRKGYSYRDIMQGRFDVKVRYDALLMPEFFGGCTRDFETHSVTQTVDQAQGINPTYAEALGSQAGLSGVRGSANANIECFCDEESIIIGVMIISPSAVYTQLLPKHFTYRGLMDHFQPEFNNIGFQPILYKEVCPIQAYNANPDSLTDTFGYNRPWYEYVQKYDQAHGLFRTDLSNFLMHRVFNQKPELAQSFLIIDPEQVTDVFAVTETTDKIYGQIRMNCTVKLPVSRVAIPRLD